MCGLRKLRLERSIFNFGCDSSPEEFEFMGDYSPLIIFVSKFHNASLFNLFTCKADYEFFSEGILFAYELVSKLKLAIDLLSSLLVIKAN